MDVASAALQSPSEAATPSPEQAAEPAFDALAAYLRSVPYDCESPEAMQEKLDGILAKVTICAASKDWKGLSSWFAMLQCWMSLKYPLPKTTRVHLVQLSYELILMPAADTNLVRSWADFLQRLIGEKPGAKRKLESSDLQLDWKPLWRVLQKEIWPKKTDAYSSRNMINLFLYVAERCHRFYPVDEIPAMLEAFTPQFTQESMNTMLAVIIAFMPPTGIHLYLPLIFKLWEASNSNSLDERIIELLGNLAEEHVAGSAGPDTAPWKDIGIFTANQWTLIMAKCLGSFHVPVASMKGSSSTAVYADTQGSRVWQKLKKSGNRFYSFAQIFVYSMSVDGAMRTLDSSATDTCLAGSKALDALDRLVTSTESFFHPSNSGTWTTSLTTFVKYLTSEFLKRWKEEESSACMTPVTQRLTLVIRRSLVNTLRTPCLLAMFSKDIVAASFAQVSLKTLAVLEPNLVMPQIMERISGGLEVVNETHRTTTSLSTLAMLALPLVNESIWLGGQKHLLTLLELSLPGIDMNDPNKTMATALFISTVASQIRLGAALAPYSETMDDVPMDTPDAMDTSDDLTNEEPTLTRAEERQIVRDSTYQFEEWALSFFRQVLRLYENLPEEGGKSNKAGGKTEDSMLSAVKTALDMVCQHLSDEIFDSVLQLTYDYATSNAKPNAVRAFGQLISSLGRVHPEKTIDKFLPHCSMKIEEELLHGASSVRTTSTTPANPSDTVFHWNLIILRACLGYGGAGILKHKHTILKLVSLLIEYAKNERGYSGVGRLIIRLLHNLGGTYTREERFVNPEEWASNEFKGNHFLHWGKQYKADEVVVDWHVPTEPEIEFILELLDAICIPLLDRIDELLESVRSWDNVARNDFCRFLQITRSVWNGLPTFIKLPRAPVPKESLDSDIDIPSILFPVIEVEAGFSLADPADPRYQRVLGLRERFGGVLHRAAVALQHSETEDHIDAVIQLCKGIDVYLLEYAINRSTYSGTAKSFLTRRDGHRIWSKQKEFPRSVYIKRAQYYHHGRLYMHSLYRGRSQIDDNLIQDLVEMSLSSYTRVRRYGQSVLFAVCSTYARSTRFCLPRLMENLKQGTQPDRMKGALHTLGNKAIVSYSISDGIYQGKYLMALLECSHQDKSSIQDLVKSIIADCVSCLSEEALSPDGSPLDSQIFDTLLEAIASGIQPGILDADLDERARKAVALRNERRAALYDFTTKSIADLAQRDGTHWKYVQYSIRLLHGYLRRDKAPSENIAKFFFQCVCSPESVTRSYSQRSITQILRHVKLRSYSAGSKTNLWLEEYMHPLMGETQVEDPQELLNLWSDVSTGPENGGLFIDKLRTGFLVWRKSLTSYHAPAAGDFRDTWEDASKDVIAAIRSQLSAGQWFQQVATLWSQESNRAHSSADLRTEHFMLIKMLSKIFGPEFLDQVLPMIESLCLDSDKFKQRAGVEFLLGYTRGAKHWPSQFNKSLWDWVMARLPKFFASIKPDTRHLWDSYFCLQQIDWDPRRLPDLNRWIFSAPLEFRGDSAFAMGKQLGLFATTVEIYGIRFKNRADKYLSLLFENVDSDFAEIREQVAHCVDVLLATQWQPGYKSCKLLQTACEESADPIQLRKAPHISAAERMCNDLPLLRGERLPPPKVAHSKYDRTGMTLLQWLWNTAHGSRAPTIFEYALPFIPEMFHMSECNDNAELVKYSLAVLFVLSAITPPLNYVEPISSSMISMIRTSESWRVRQNALPILLVFFYRNLASFSDASINEILNAIIDCLRDENVEVRSTAGKVFAGVLRCSQRSQIPSLRERFLKLEGMSRLPRKSDASYAEALRVQHSAILGLCALMDCFPYVVEPWMPPLMEVFARHSTDPPPISTTIRTMASDFKKTHQDTWHSDKFAFTEDELQALNTILVGTSYYA